MHTQKEEHDPHIWHDDELAENDAAKVDFRAKSSTYPLINLTSRPRTCNSQF